MKYTIYLLNSSALIWHYTELVLTHKTDNNKVIHLMYTMVTAY